MDPTIKRPLGRSGVEVTQLGLGGASYGSIYREVSEQDALDTIAAAWDAGVRYFDTSPWYGRGPLRAAHRGRPALPAARRVRAVVEGRALLRRGQNPAATPTSPPGSRRRRSCTTTTTPTTASCAATSRASCAWAWRYYDIGVIHDLDFWTHKTEDMVQHYLDQLEQQRLACARGAAPQRPPQGHRRRHQRARHDATLPGLL